MNNNWFKILVILALLINAGTLIYFLSSGPKDRPHRRPAQILNETLKLDTKQQETYAVLRKSHHITHDSLLKVIATQRQYLYNEKQMANDSLLTKIGLLQKEIERVTYEHFKEVRQICTPEQQVKLDTLLAKTAQNVLNIDERKGRKKNNN